MSRAHKGVENIDVFNFWTPAYGSLLAHTQRRKYIKLFFVYEQGNQCGPDQRGLARTRLCVKEHSGMCRDKRYQLIGFLVTTKEHLAISLLKGPRANIGFAKSLHNFSSGRLTLP